MVRRCYQTSSEEDTAKRPLDFNPERILTMDEAGIDVVVLSLTMPGAQNLDGPLAVKLAASSNDRLEAEVQSQPDRFESFATLPTPPPQEAAKELERAVRKLVFNGAMLHGRTRDRNLSDKGFWPIFEVADSPRAPLYLHPQSPQQGVPDAYYTGFGEEIDALFGRPGIGWHYEAGFAKSMIVYCHCSEMNFRSCSHGTGITLACSLTGPTSPTLRRLQAALGSPEGTSVCYADCSFRSSGFSVSMS